MGVIILFMSFIILLITGIPVGFSMLFSSILYIVVNGRPAFTFIAQRLTSSLISFTLLAIPFFIIAGNLMNELKVSEKIFNFAKSIIGHIRGGLAHVNILASFIFAGMSGSSAADAGGLGLVEIKAMKEDDYPDEFAAGITAASSAIGPIVPPSVMLVIFGVMTGTSVGKLFLSGFIPGILMVIALMLQVSLIAKRKNFPIKGSFTFSNFFKALRKGLFAILTPIILLVFLIAGIVTPAELGIILIVYLLIVSFIYSSLNISSLKKAFIKSANLNAQVLFLIATASIMGNILVRENIPELLMTMVNKFPILNSSTFLILLSFVLLILGCFIEGVAIETLIIPIVAPVATELGINSIHLGLVIVLAIELGLITPPLGIGVYIASDIANVSVDKTFREAIKFLIPLSIVLLITIFFPEVVLYIPKLIFG